MVVEKKFAIGQEPDPSEFLFISMEMRMKDESVPYDAKTSCWVPDPADCYTRGDIRSTEGDFVMVWTGSEEKKFKKDLVGQVNPPKYEKCEDMSNLTFLNDASVLWNLKNRYQAKLIYTYSGLFCIAVNPYVRYPIYTVRAMKIYTNKRRNECPPHIFAIAEGAYQNMIQDHENQSILITGESGAGKTENTKKVIAYFANVGASSKALKRRRFPLRIRSSKLIPSSSLSEMPRLPGMTIRRDSVNSSASILDQRENWLVLISSLVRSNNFALREILIQLYPSSS
ncbi:Myosin heavy chain, muscle [Folsomia candida]|uniref:Myosin heavy chain, muscle n=1 Tax=Folsomia candida TaxID=158441 RepID=A0A226D216_FOLCA|nr:Myosin heavy chain, muscle [Folsomia candida]